MNQAATTELRPRFRPIRSGGTAPWTTSASRLRRRRTAGTFKPRDLFLLEVLLSVLAAIAVVLAGATDGALLLRLLSGSPWMH